MHALKPGWNQVGPKGSQAPPSLRGEYIYIYLYILMTDSNKNQ